MTHHFRSSVVKLVFITTALVGTSSVVWANSDGNFSIHVPIPANSCKAIMVGVGGSLADYFLEIKSTNGSCPASSLRYSRLLSQAKRSIV